MEKIPHLLIEGMIVSHTHWVYTPPIFIYAVNIFISTK